MQQAQATPTVESASPPTPEKPLAPPGPAFPANGAPGASQAEPGGSPITAQAADDDAGAIEYDSWRVVGRPRG